MYVLRSLADFQFYVGLTRDLRARLHASQGIRRLVGEDKEEAEGEEGFRRRRDRFFIPSSLVIRPSSLRSPSGCPYRKCAGELTESRGTNEG